MVDRRQAVDGGTAERESPASRGLTEDEWVAEIRKILGDEAPGVRLGVGDDAALVQIGDREAILTTDLLVEGVHFRLDTISPRDLGYKAVVVNVSDVAAMGGSPRYGLASVAVPPAIEPGWLVELYGGIRDAATEYATAIVGGDTSRSERIVLSVAVVGEAVKGRAVTRSGGQPGDRLVVTGALGASAGGLRLAEAEPEVVRPAIASDWGRALLAAHVRPQARVGEGQTLCACGATAMIDVSDGLALDLTRLCRESGVGAVLQLARLPVSPALAKLAEVIAVEPLDLALAGGEDYELLAALPADAVEGAATQLLERFGTSLTVVGEMRSTQGVVLVEADGSERSLETLGWDHFAQ